MSYRFQNHLNDSDANSSEHPIPKVRTLGPQGIALHMINFEIPQIDIEGQDDLELPSLDPRHRGAQKINESSQKLNSPSHSSISIVESQTLRGNQLSEGHPIQTAPEQEQGFGHTVLNLPGRGYSSSLRHKPHDPQETIGSGIGPKMDSKIEPRRSISVHEEDSSGGEESSESSQFHFRNFKIDVAQKDTPQYLESLLLRKAALMPWLYFNMAIAIVEDIEFCLTLSSVTQAEIIVEIPRVIALLALIAVTVFVLRKNCQSIILGLALIQIRLVTAPLSSQSTPIDDTEDASRELYLMQEVWNEMAEIFMLAPILLNTILACQVIEEPLNYGIFLASTGVLSCITIGLLMPIESYSWMLVSLQILGGLLYMVAMLYLFYRAGRAITQESLRLVLFTQHENNQFRKIINTVEEAMLIIKNKASIQFMNTAASEIFDKSLEAAFTEKNFYLFEQYKEEDDDARSIRSREISTTMNRDGLKPLSLRDLMLRSHKLNKQQIYTRHKEIAGFKTMNQLSKFLARLKVNPVRRVGFDFFLLKFQKLEGEDSLVQFIDISEKIVIDSMNIEKKYLTYINATVSHEMRNPLNSINAQIENQRVLLTELDTFVHDNIDPELEGQASLILEDFFECLSISQSSCKLMNFSVEDIMSLTSLREGKLSKSLQSVDIAASTAEVSKILEWTASQKNVSQTTLFQGFPADGSSKVKIDEQRFQQVLLNYVSNALKFIDKPKGNILVVLQLVPKMVTQVGTHDEAAIRFIRQQVQEFYGENIMEADFRVSQISSQSARDPYDLFKRDVEDKLVLSVFDNGIGIKEGDREKLYKLFGCLSRNQSMNTKGIGLGLVISKMISESFGGRVKMHTKQGLGSIFQSSFLLSEDLSPQHRLSTGVLPVDLRLDSYQEARKALKGLPRHDQEQILRQFIACYEAEQTRACLLNYERFQANEESPQEREMKILLVDDEPYNCASLFQMIKGLKLENVKQRVEISLGGRDALKRVLANLRFVGQQPAIEVDDIDDEFLGPSPATSAQISEEAVDMLVHRLQRKIDGKLKGPIISPLLKRGEVICDFDLILTDCSMPFIDGYKFTRLARQVFEECEITNAPSIVAVTGHVEVDYQLKAIDSGMDKIYSKPISFECVGRLLLERGFKIQVPKGVAEDLLAKKAASLQPAEA